jgi:transcriptional regulator with XRE-family HTH domain
MATNPNEIRLNKEERERLASIADKNGKPWRETFREALSKYERGVPDDEVDIDEEIRTVFGIEPEELKPVSLERVHEILSKVPGSMADDIIADRGNR